MFLLNTCVIRPQWWWCEVISSDSESKRTKTLTQFHQHTAAELKQRTTHQIQSKSIFKCVYFVHQTDINNHVSAPEWLQLSESSREKQCRCENQTKLLKNNLSRFRICLCFLQCAPPFSSQTGTGAFFLFNSSFFSHEINMKLPLRFVLSVWFSLICSHHVLLDSPCEQKSARKLSVNSFSFHFRVFPVKWLHPVS